MRSLGTLRLAASYASIRISHCKAARATNEQPYARKRSLWSALSGPQPQLSGPSQPFQKCTRSEELATARPSRITEMNFAFGKIACRNPIRGQPVILQSNRGRLALTHACAAARIAWWGIGRA